MQDITCSIGNAQLTELLLKYIDADIVRDLVIEEKKEESDDDDEYARYYVCNLSFGSFFLIYVI